MAHDMYSMEESFFFLFPLVVHCAQFGTLKKPVMHAYGLVQIHSEILPLHVRL